MVKFIIELFSIFNIFYFSFDLPSREEKFDIFLETLYDFVNA